MEAGGRQSKAMEGAAAFHARAQHLIDAVDSDGETSASFAAADCFACLSPSVAFSPISASLASFFDAASALLIEPQRLPHLPS